MNWERLLKSLALTVFTFITIVVILCIIYCLSILADYQRCIIGLLILFAGLTAYFYHDLGFWRKQ